MKTQNVADYLTAAVPTAKAGDTAGEILARLPGRRFESTHTVYVVDADGVLIGAAPLADVLAADSRSEIGALMQRNPPAVRPDLDREDAASLAIREDLVVVPVVDAGGRLLGVFPAHAIMSVLREEHLEDLHHMAGIWHRSDEARRALEAPPVQRARYRLPWLAVGLLGSMLATVLVARFEDVLEMQIALAFFMPAIVYLADAVGTQSEAVAIRGLSLTDNGFGRLLRGEVAAGALMGAILASVGATFTLVVFGQMDLAVTVGVSLLMACTIATTLGLCLPWAFIRIGWDPAHASGPIGTIVQDVLSLLIYFAAATALL